MINPGSVIMPLMEPFLGFAPAALNSQSVPVHIAKLLSSPGVPLLCRLPVEVRGLFVVLTYTGSVIVLFTELEERFRIILHRLR